MRRVVPGFLPAALAGALLLAAADRARADFLACNDSVDVVNLAVGQEEARGFVTRGWWTIGPNRCATVIRGALPRHVYVHAMDVFGQALVDGLAEFCVDERGFEILGAEDCWQRGHIAARFTEIDTGGADRWVLFLGDHGS